MAERNNDVVTHAEGGLVGFAICGEFALFFVDNPTCLRCIAGDFDEWDIRRILEMNSVKDLQETEDKKFMDAVDVLIEKNKP